jgi:hypothetical protein
MPLVGRHSKKNLFADEQIRDTVLHTSASVGMQVPGLLIIKAKNTLNQAITLIYQGTLDEGSTWVTLATVTLNATTGEDIQTLTQGWDEIRCTAQATISPASGTLKVKSKWNQIVG